MFESLRRRLFGTKTKGAHATHSTSKGARHVVRKPTKHQPGRDTSAAFRTNRYLAFFNGEDVKIYTSDWVDSAQWDEEAGILRITFDDGHVHYYPCSQDEAILFADAPSKGGWIHDHYLSKGIKGSPG